MIFINEYKLIVTNSNGESIDLWNDKEVALTSIDGISMEAEVHTSVLGESDGSYFNGSHIPERSISIIVQYRIEAIDAEKSKLRVYRIFRPKEKITMRFISPNQDVYIEGYIEKCNTPPTNFPMVTQISIKAPDPYFRKSFVEPMQLFGISKRFYFLQEGITLNRICFGNSERSKLVRLDYGGDTSAGVVIRVALNADCGAFRIDNFTVGKYIAMSGEFKEGDVIEISSVPRNGCKYAELTRYGVVSNALAYLDAGSSMWELIPGENVIKFTADGLAVTAADVMMYYDVKVGGV